jgi:[acyl-carrier-protein] S-malonyltransferase
MEDLTMTVNLQPAVTAVNLACLAAIAKENVEFHYCAGHSLGEYSALSAAGVHSKEDAGRLVFKRGELMHREATRNQGVMHAIVGLPMDAVAELVCEVQKDGIVSVANHNTELQIVITGAPRSVEKVSLLAVEKAPRKNSRHFLISPRFAHLKNQYYLMSPPTHRKIPTKLKRSWGASCAVPCAGMMP